MNPFYRRYETDTGEFAAFRRTALGDFCFLACWDQNSNTATRLLCRMPYEHVSTIDGEAEPAHNPLSTLSAEEARKLLEDLRAQRPSLAIRTPIMTESEYRSQSQDRRRKH